MKDVIVSAFVIWITVQLVLIGTISVDLHNQTVSGEYECVENGEGIPVILGALIPLTAFIPTDVVDEYCDYIIGDK